MGINYCTGRNRIFFIIPKCQLFLSFATNNEVLFWVDKHIAQVKTGTDYITKDTVLNATYAKQVAVSALETE